MPNYDVLYLRGELMNVLSRALTVTTSSEDSNFPLENLYDGHPDQPFRFGSNSSDREFVSDNNIVVNGGFETSTLDGWTDASSGTGAISEETTAVNTGSNALDCAGGASGEGNAYRDHEFSAGERLTIDAAIRGTSADATVARVQVQNLQTGKWLTSTGGWGSTETDAFTDAGSTYSLNTLNFQAEDFSTCLADKVTLRVACYTDDTGSAYFDDIAIYPQINFVGVFGHNLSPVVSLELHSSTDNFSAGDTTEATLTLDHPSCFAVLSTGVAKRYWKLLSSGTNTTTPWYGLVVLGYAETQSASRAWGTQTVYSKAQVRHTAQSGKQYVTGAGGRATRSVRWEFKIPTETDTVETRDEIIERSGYGEFPLVVALRDSDTEQLVIHGRVGSVWTHAHTLIDEYESGLEIIGDPFPSEVS